MLRTALGLSMAATFVALSGSPVKADYPDQPITMILPFGAGAASDTVARFLADSSAEGLGTTFVVQNRPGATGALAAREAAMAEPNGYTIMISSNSAHAANVHLYEDLQYDPVEDFTTITGVTRNPLVLVTRPGLPTENLEEFIAYAKEHPGELTFGYGNTLSLANPYLLMSRVGIDAVGASYDSVPDVVVDVLGERIDFAFVDPFLAADHIQSGTLRPLGVTSSARVESLPDVPPIADVVPDYEMVGWIAAFAPAGTPDEVIETLNGAFVEALSRPESEQKLIDLGMQSFATTPKQLDDWVRSQVVLWGEVLQAAGVDKQ